MGKPQAGSFCIHCNAWLGCLGLEPSPELYVDHLVQIFREVKRVLRNDGQVWLNIADSYFGGGNNRGNNSPISAKQASNKGATGQCAEHQKNIGTHPILKSKDMVLIPFRLALALQSDGAADPKAMELLARIEIALLKDYETWDEVPIYTKRELEQLSKEYEQAQTGGWWIRSDIIWHKPNCLAGSTRVYAQTQKGEMPMMVKDMVRLNPSTVKLWNGAKWTQVISWTENHYPAGQLEIKLRSGEKIGCTGEHLWPTDRGNVEARHLQVGDVLQNTQLPEPIFYKKPSMLDADDIGWFIGIYLAEGSRGKGGKCIQITSHTDEVKDRYRRLRNIATAYHGTCTFHKTGGKCATVNIHSKILNGVIDTYISGKLSKGKHLSMKCWERSNDFLFALLEGYLEGDGHNDVKNNRWRIGFTRNKNLANDLRTLCGRLGIHLRLHNAHAMCEGKKFPTYRGEIRFRKSTHHNTKADSEIVAIRKTKGQKFWDIAVKDEPHLFALASGVLTHNCMPSSVKDRPTTDFEHVFLLAKSKKYYYNQDAIREPHTWIEERERPTGMHRNAQKYREKVNYGGGGTGFAGHSGGYKADGSPLNHPLGRNKRTVWTVNTKPYKGAHFATFPPDLIKPMVLAGSSDKTCPHCGTTWGRISGRQSEYPVVPDSEIDRYGTGKAGVHRKIGGQYQKWLDKNPIVTTGFEPSCDCPENDGSAASIVLDPFAGSGTACAVAKSLGRHWVGIEPNREYCELARKRIANECFQATLF